MMLNRFAVAALVLFCLAGTAPAQDDQLQAIRSNVSQAKALLSAGNKVPPGNVKQAVSLLTTALAQIDLQRAYTDRLLADLKVQTDKAAVLLAENSQLKTQKAELESLLAQARARIAELEAALAECEDEEDPPPPPPPPPPSPFVALEVRETGGVDRHGALVSTGVPLAEDAGITDVAQLAVADASGKPIPADIRPTGWWRSRKAPNGLQWVQVSFAADLPANGTASYKLLLGVAPGTNPGPAGSFSVATLAGNTVMVDTGVAAFEVGPSGLFRSGSFGGKRLISASEASATFNGQSDTLSEASGVRRVEVEYVGPLVAYVQTESSFPVLSFGGARVSILRRYEFRRGSGVVKIGERVAWEGTLNGTNWQLPDGSVNGILGTLWSERAALSAPPSTIAVLPEIGRDVHRFLPGAEVSLRQRLRENRLDPRRYELSAAGVQVSTGVEATGAVLAAVSSEGTVVTALRQMSRYEPQGLYYRPGSIEIRLGDDRFWLAHHQGAHADLTVALLGPDASEGDLAAVWAETNRPLRALAAPEYYSVADVAGIGPKSLPAALADYDKALQSIATETMATSAACGIWGLQTWTGWPWYWDSRCDFGREGTGIGWDNYFLSTGMTDYYSTSASAVRLALRSGAAAWLDDLAFPSAQRMLHTQIWQCSPTDSASQCGASLTGYSAYRSDYNSSHQYWEGPYWYYFLTGDPLVIPNMARGIRGQLSYLNLPTTAMPGRFAHQFMGAMRFLATAHPDPEEGKFFGDLYDLYMARELREHYVEGVYNGQPVAFLTESAKKVGFNNTGNLYTLGWDAEDLFWYGKRTGDPVAHAALVKLARTAIVYGPAVVGGDGPISGKWARGFQFNLAADGTITSLATHESGGETLLYPGDKPFMASLFSRAATLSGDPAIAAKSRELVLYSIRYILDSKLPLGKLMGLAEARLGAAVAEEARRP